MSLSTKLKMTAVMATVLMAVLWTVPVPILRRRELRRRRAKRGIAVLLGACKQKAFGGRREIPSRSKRGREASTLCVR